MEAAVDHRLSRSRLTGLIFLNLFGVFAAGGAVMTIEGGFGRFFALLTAVLMAFNAGIFFQQWRNGRMS